MMQKKKMLLWARKDGCNFFIIINSIFSIVNVFLIH